MRVDILIVGDLGSASATSTGLAPELRALHSGGYTVGLAQTRPPERNGSTAIDAEVEECIERGMAVQVGRSDNVVAELVVVRDPEGLTGRPADLPQIVGKQGVLVVDKPIVDRDASLRFDAEAVHSTWGQSLGGQPTWVAGSPAIRRSFEAARLTSATPQWHWPIVVESADHPKRPRPAKDIPVIGCYRPSGQPERPDDRERLLQLYPAGTDIEVRTFGDRAAAGTLPAVLPINWRLFDWDDIEYRGFLSTIDFLIVYPHPDDAIEERAIARAIAAGVIAILPDCYEECFGEAALYRSSQDVLAAVREYHECSETYRLRSELCRHLVSRRYRPEHYLERIGAVVGQPARPTATSKLSERSADHAETTPVAGDRQRRADTFDIAIVSDFRARTETGWRVAEEIRLQASAGYRTALVHLPSARVAAHTIHPAIDSCVRSGMATPVDPVAGHLEVKLVVVAAPELLAEFPEVVPHIRCERALAVLDTLPERFDPRQIQRVLDAIFGPKVSWAATTKEISAKLERLVVRDEHWLTAIDAEPRRRFVGRNRPVIGCVDLAASGNPLHAEGATAPDLVQQGFEVRVLRPEVAGRRSATETPAGYVVFGADEIDLRRFIDSLDVFAWFPRERPAQVPLTAIGLALAKGIPVLLPPDLDTGMPAGPVHVPAQDLLAQLRVLTADREAYRRASVAVSEAAERALVGANHSRRLRRLMAPAVSPSPPARTEQSGPRRVLFVSSNGVGIGHLTRLLAIARRMPEDVSPVFATMSQALPIVEQFGYPVEFLTPHIYAGVDSLDWDGWLRDEMDEIIDFHRAAAVVFDGNYPYQGVVLSAATRPECRLVWIRRGMWRNQEFDRQFLERQRFFDVVIEPGDVAEQYDSGLTAQQRDGVLRVDPIRLLDEGELLPREAAAAELSLDTSRPSVLLQLGSGSNRDIIQIMDNVAMALRKHPSVQVVNAEWWIANTGVGLWPGVVRLRGHPITRYYKAFDFTIAAAGYNSFNEILSFGLPAIFIPNAHETMDDQIGRARYAQDNGAAFYLPEQHIGEIDDVITALLGEETRALLRVNCRGLARANGASAAADAIAAMIR